MPSSVWSKINRNEVVNNANGLDDTVKFDGEFNAVIRDYYTRPQFDASPKTKREARRI